MATAAHTTRYDLQAGMVADAIRTATRWRAIVANGIKAAWTRFFCFALIFVRQHYKTPSESLKSGKFGIFPGIPYICISKTGVPGGGGRHPASMTGNRYQWRRQHIRRGTTSRRVWRRHHTELTADVIRNGDQVARADGYHGRAVAPYCPDDDGSTYGYHSKLTARIMAGASAQWYGTRTATVRVQYVGASLEVATASHIDDGQRTPMAAAAHMTRYDLHADMVAGVIRNGDQVADIMAKKIFYEVIHYFSC